jgi:hypothetical protein
LHPAQPEGDVTPSTSVQLLVFISPIIKSGVVIESAPIVIATELANIYLLMFVPFSIIVFMLNTLQ